MLTTRTSGHGRITFEKLRVEPADKNECVVLVTLAWPDGEAFLGTCKGDGSDTGQLSCSATAAVKALEAASDHRVALALEGITEVSEMNAVMVHVTAALPEGGDLLELCGSSLVRGEPRNAAVKAVLKATNRLFETDFSFAH